MEKHKRIIAFASCLGMGLLIFDCKTALEGARDGMTLVLNVMIPSLFPFLFLSIALTGSIQKTKLPFGAFAEKLFHLPPGTSSLLLTGFLGGYPAGAQAVCLAYRRGTVSKENSEKMLAFCNNAGPSFLFGMVSACFSEARMLWALWLFHILGALAAAQMYPCSSEESQLPGRNTALSVTDILKQSLAVMSIICGWVVLFRVLITFADRWFLWIMPDQARILFVGFLELSNGICELTGIPDEKIRFLMCSALLSLGGLCVMMQTHSVTEGLKKRYFYLGKLIQLLVSCCLGAVLMYRAYLLLLLPVIPFLIPKNRSRNPAAAGV